MKKSFSLSVLVLMLTAVLSACGGGGGGGGAAPTYSAGGTVSGLTGTVVLQNNGADDLTITAAGTFTFSTALANGAGYSVTVKTQPSGQTCYVSNGSGTIAGADVLNVSITCGNSGSLDPSFGTGGVVTTATASNGASINALAIQADGKIVAAGSAQALDQNFALARYNADGTPDSSFDGDGVIISNMGIQDSANAVALQPDGKIVAAGVCDSKFALVRYCANGYLDDGTDVASGGCGGAGFGSGGLVTTLTGGTASVHGVAIQADGKIVAAGRTWINPSWYFALVRYNTDGTLDTSFDTDGIVTTVIGSSAIAYALAVQSDGKIVVAGSSAGKFALARFCANGHLDDGTAVASGGCGGAGFGTGGAVTTAIGTLGNARAVAIQTDGKIVAAGDAMLNGLKYEFAVARYNTDGSLDTSFDTDGIVTTVIGGYEESANAVAIQTDGKIVAAGRSSDSIGTYRVALVRYHADGSLDTSFDGDGKVESLIGDNGSEVYTKTMALQTDGRIVAAGYAYAPGAAINDFMVVRYWP